MIIKINKKNTGKKFQNCWEFINCPIEHRKNCIVYIRNLGEGCWLVTNEVGKGNYAFEKYKGCKNCPWYENQNS